MIQDINTHKLDIVYDGKAILEESDLIVAFSEKDVYMKKQQEGEAEQFLVCSDILPVEYRQEAMERYRKAAVYLLRLDGKRLFLLPDRYLKDAWQSQKRNINIFREKTEENRAMHFAMITAWHLYQWYEETKFCGACGVRLRHGKEERTMVCPICGNTIYPRIYPAVIVGVYDGSRILLTKMSPSAQYYALVSGYCEAGETLEETARREVMEETGLSIGPLTYYKSQPWAASQSVLSGYFARLEGSADIHIDGKELCEARWVEREELEGCYSDSGISLTAEMIAYFHKHPEKFPGGIEEDIENYKIDY